jgi:hypothetical protein
MLGAQLGARIPIFREEQRSRVYRLCIWYAEVLGRELTMCRHSFSAAALAIAMAAALPACSPFTEMPSQSNLGYVGGIWVAPASGAVGSAPAQTGTSGGVTARADFCDSDMGGWATARAHGEAAFGGNTSGVAGRVRVLGEAGAFTGSRAEHHFFGRLGVAGEIERTPYQGLFLLEAPTLFTGYEHHTREESGFLNLLHVDVGPRAGLADVGRVFAASTRTDLVAVPEVGGEVFLLGTAVTADASYMRLFTRDGLNSVYASACVGVLLALCADARFLFGTFATARGKVPDVSTVYVGLTLGLGVIGSDRRRGAW